MKAVYSNKLQIRTQRPNDRTIPLLLIHFGVQRCLTVQKLNSLYTPLTLKVGCSAESPYSKSAPRCAYAYVRAYPPFYQAVIGSKEKNEN